MADFKALARSRSQTNYFYFLHPLFIKNNIGCTSGQGGELLCPRQ